MSDGSGPWDFPGTCPAPALHHDVVQLAHGGGGLLSDRLVRQVFLPAFGLSDVPLHDGAFLDCGGRIAISTDSFVIQPLFFPGGDIGSLAVHGTVNDLAMCGARPLALTAAFVLEEGMPIADLQRIADSFGQAARDVGVRIVTGDTKVVDRGKGDGVYINTTGIGRVPHGLEIGPQRAQPGDAVILTGPIAAHGIAILALRQGLDFGTPLRSDSAPLCDLANLLVDALFNDVHVLRDPTRGGLASALNEIAETAGVGFLLDEAAIAVPDTARAACELLGLDPLYVANEGKFVAIVAAERADEAVHLLRQHPQGSQASLIGRVTAEHAGRVLARSCVGGIRTVDRLVGDQLPRIC